MSGLASAGECSVVVTDPMFGAQGDGVTDDTAAIQSAIAYLNVSNFPNGGGGIVCFPSGIFLISQITLTPNVSLHGTGIGPAGMNGTLIVQKDRVNQSAIVNDPDVLTPADYWHWSEIKNLRLTKALGSADKTGSGIEVNCRSGEGFKIEHVIVQGFPQHGISFRRGGAPLYLEDLHLSNNGTYGLNISRTGNDTWSMVQATIVSGDDNGVALIGIDTAGARGEVFWLNGLKAEISTAGRQSYLVDMRNTNGSPVFIRNVSASGVGGAGVALVRNSGSGSRIHLEGVGASNFQHVISDTYTNRTIDTFNFFTLVYGAAGEMYRGIW
jgi:hypothetical protein